MSIKGFSVGGVVQRYDYTALDNLPQGQGVSDDLKAALLQLAQKVAYIDDQGQTYYDALYDALYPEKTLLSITANFQQGQAVVYNTDTLDSLKQYLTVTAIYDDASTETVPSSAYTLSGTLTTGTSVITVTYEGKTDAFNVTVTAAPMALTVTNNLTGCTTNNSATSVLQNSSYTAVITASSGYTLVGATVSITMGGQDVTTSVYSGGIISINSVTGALVISVAAVAVVLSSISAVYTQSGTVYTADTLDSLKADLVVTANYSDSSTQTVPDADYTLSGTLTVGTSTITVAYGGKTTTFSVTVTAVPFEYGVYTPETVVRGKVITSTGIIQDATQNSAYIDDFIDVVRESYWIGYQNAPVSATGWSLSNFYVAEYDRSYGFVKKTQYAGKVDGVTVNLQYMARIITFDQNTRYIRLGWYDQNSTTAVASFDIEDPSTIVELPMEIGDISSTTGANTTQAKRIRTADYIQISETISVTGCPFAETWHDWRASSVYGVRCYNASKQFLGNASGIPNPAADVANVSLPAGTAYVRFIMQKGNADVIASFAQLVNHLFSVNGQRYYVLEAQA